MFKFSGSIKQASFADDLHDAETFEVAKKLRKGRVSEDKYVKLLGTKADRAIEKNERAWFRAKSRQGVPDDVGQTAANVAYDAAAGGVGGVVSGGITGLGAGILASLATAPFRKFDNVKIVGPVAKGLAAVGGVFGALKGADEGWRKSKKPQKDPGLLKDYGNIKYLKQFKKDLQNPKSQQYKDWVKEEMY